VAEPSNQKAITTGADRQSLRPVFLGLGGGIVSAFAATVLPPQVQTLVFWSGALLVLAGVMDWIFSAVLPRFEWGRGVRPLTKVSITLNVVLAIFALLCLWQYSVQLNVVYANSRNVPQALSEWGWSYDRVYARIDSAGIAPYLDKYKVALICRVEDATIDFHNDRTKILGNWFRVDAALSRIELVLPAHMVQRVTAGENADCQLVAVPVEMDTDVNNGFKYQTIYTFGVGSPQRTKPIAAKPVGSAEQR
jgi:hypothetical protein